MNKIPEIMAPVSNMEMLLAAIHAGADSVYIGMPDFNARGRADKLSLDLLQELIETARLYSVKTYIAFNILIFEDELEEALKSFEGTVIVVSHDRYFLNRVVDLLVVLEGNGRSEVVYGNYDTYELLRAARDQAAKEAGHRHRALRDDRILAPGLAAHREFQRADRAAGRD